MEPTSPPIAYPCCLTLNRLQLSVRIGLHENERTEKLPVEVDARFYFPALPRGCERDDAPSLCYDQLATAVKKTIEAREFKLIEYLAFEVHRCLKDAIARMGQAGPVAVWVKATKLQLPIPNVLGGASFIYSDLPPQIPAVDVR